MSYDIIIVGGGIAGLTSAAFIAKAGLKTLLCEKQSVVGGLVSSFYHEGFLFDGGARGIVDSGIVKPMLNQLGLSLELNKSIVSIGIEDQMVYVESISSLTEYRDMLAKLYPDSGEDIDLILAEMRKVMDYMDILYGIENPLFKDLKKDREYLLKTLIPWSFRFVMKARKIKNFNSPVYDYLGKLSDNESLIDIISQHFFQETPASFALSYFSLYLDYEYPVKGTQELVDVIKQSINNSRGVVHTDTEIGKIDIANKVIYDVKGKAYEYKKLIWAADINQLYKVVDMETVLDSITKKNIEERKALIDGKKGGDSIFSLFLAVDLDKNYFKELSSGHCFYTPSKFGQSKIFDSLHYISRSTNKTEIYKWMSDYLEHTTYEIAIPSLRNENLAPKGKTGLVISVLMDHGFISNIKSLGLYEDFKSFAESKIIDVINDNLYKGLKNKVIFSFSSTPLTIERLTGNHEGGITGWAFTNTEIPSVTKMTHIKKSCETPIPDVYQAGQWTYSPSGLPISILTGKIAADAVVKSFLKNKM